MVEHANTARDLQNLPANELTPAALAEHALARAGEIEGLEVEVLGRDRIAELKMGGLLAVREGLARGAAPDRAALRRRRRRRSGIVGKAVTFDTGGISIKPSAKMQEMKMDMSGGAAAIEATAAIARLGLPVNVITVVPATENMPSGHATRPGDIITISNGKTVEVNNTDAEGRLILADALAYAASEGAERIVDLATLTGAIITALGSTYAGLFSNDDGFAERSSSGRRASGELVWRMPLHPDYKELTRGKVADLVNASEVRKASSAYAASFLEEFVDGKPWVAPRHRGHGLGPGQPRLRRQGRDRLRRAPAGGAGPHPGVTGLTRLPRKLLRLPAVPRQLENSACTVAPPLAGERGCAGGRRPPAPSIRAAGSPRRRARSR